MHNISIDFWRSLIIFIDDTSGGGVNNMKALNYGYLKTNVFAVAKMLTISNKMK